MGYLGISQVRTAPETGKVLDVIVHRIRQIGKPGQVSLDAGQKISYLEIAGRIRAGDVIYVVVPDAEGHRYADCVRVRPSDSSDEYIESHDAKGDATSALTNLPKF